MIPFRTWADALAEQEAGEPQAEPQVMGTMAMAMDAEMPPAVYSAGPTVNRANGEGPPRCCAVDSVTADKLVWYGGLPEDALARVRAALPHLTDVSAEDIYLCGGCREYIKWGGVLSPEEMPRAFPVG